MQFFMAAGATFYNLAASLMNVESCIFVFPVVIKSGLFDDFKLMGVRSQHRIYANLFYIYFIEM